MQIQNKESRKAGKVKFAYSCLPAFLINRVLTERQSFWAKPRCGAEEVVEANGQTRLARRVRVLQARGRSEGAKVRAEVPGVGHVDFTEASDAVVDNVCGV